MSLEDAKGSKPLDKSHRNYRASEFKAVQVGTHPDPRVQLVLEQVREAESEQAIDRLRLLRLPAGQHRQRVAQINHVVQAGAKEDVGSGISEHKIFQKLIPIGIQTGGFGYP